jgi:hypothetical protein
VGREEKWDKKGEERGKEEEGGSREGQNEDLRENQQKRETH